VALVLLGRVASVLLGVQKTGGEKRWQLTARCIYCSQVGPRSRLAIIN
jgi:hypothetical protein